MEASPHMTPEERLDALLGQVTHSPERLRDAILVEIRAAVQAEHERTREAIAKAHDQRARELDVLDEVMNKGQPVTHSPEANWHRQQAAAIRAMPPQDPA